MDVKNTDQKEKLTQESGNAIAAIQNAATTAPAASIDVLTKVGTEAVRLSERPIAIQAVTSLAAVGERTPDPQARDRAADALLQLSELAKNNNAQAAELAEAAGRRLKAQASPKQ